MTAQQSNLDSAVDPITITPVVYSFEAAGAATVDGRPTRFRKDILRTGTFYPSGREWNVRPETLNRIKSSFDRAREQGNRIPLVWDHSNSAKATAGEVVDLAIENDTLYATIHAQDPEAKRRLGSVNNDVSVQVVDPWVDGKGNVYETYLRHVGIVNHPVMPDQGEFHEFSNRGNTMARTISMQNGEGEVATEPAEGAETNGAPEDTTMPVSDVISILEAALGVKFPAEVDTAKELKIALDAMMGGASASEPEAAAAAAPDAMAPMEVQELSLSLPATRRALQSAQQRLAAVLAEQRKSAEAAYRSRLDSLVEGGRIATRMMGGLIDAGKTAQWSMALLAPFDDDSPTLPTQRQSTRTLASDSVPGDKEAAEIQRHQARLRKRFGLKAEA